MVSSLAAKSNCKMPLVSLSLAYLSRGYLIYFQPGNHDEHDPSESDEELSQDESQAQRRALGRQDPVGLQGRFVGTSVLAPL